MIKKTTSPKLTKTQVTKCNQVAVHVFNQIEELIVDSINENDLAVNYEMDHLVLLETEIRKQLKKLL